MHYKYGLKFSNYQSNFALSLFLRNTGRRDKQAKMVRMMSDDQDTASPDEVSFCNVVPAWIATNDGGATPRNVPKKNGTRETLITGAVMLINQFGKNGVILRKIM